MNNVFILAMPFFPETVILHCRVVLLLVDPYCA